MTNKFRGSLGYSVLCVFLLLRITAWGNPAPSYPDTNLLPDSLQDSSVAVKVNYLSTAGLYRSLSSPDTGLLYFKQAELLAESAQDSASMLRAALNMGHFLMSRGIYDRALEYMHDGIRLAEELQDTSRQLFFLLWQSRVLTELGDHDKSIEVCEKALVIRPEKKPSAWAWNSYGEALRRAGRFEEAEENLLLAYNRFTELEEKIGLLMVGSRLSHVYQQMGKKEESRKYADQVLVNWEEQGAYESFMTASTAIIEMHITEGELDSAEQKGLYLLEKVKDRRYFRHTIHIMQILASVYEQQGDFQNSLSYTRKANRLAKDHELDKVKINLAVKDAEFTNERLLANNMLLEQQRKTQRYSMLGLGALLVLSLVIGILLFRSNKKAREFNSILQNKNVDLDEKNAILDQLNQEKDMLMQIVAHDLKSPLNSVKGLRELLEMTGELNPSQVEVVKKMDIVLERGTDLVKNLLEISALENGKIKSRIKQAELSEILRKVISDYELRAEKKSISLHLDLPDEPVLVNTDPNHYERIIDNLVSNAIKYSPKGMQVWLELKKDQGVVQTLVRDEGPGISPEDQQKLFVKFQRLTARPTGGESSSGLGLAIVKAFADQLGGKINVKSALGKGTEFAFVLPN